MEGIPNKEDGHNVGMTKEQLLQQSRREFFNKGISVDDIQLHAELVDVMRSLIIERGIDIDLKIFDKILGVFKFVEPTRTSLVVACVDRRALQFLRTEEGKVVNNYTLVSNGENRFEFGMEYGVTLGAEAEEAELLWDQYKPEVLYDLRKDALKIMGSREDEEIIAK